MRVLNYGRHLVEDDDIEAVVSVLRGDLITQGPVVEQFENALAEKVGAKYAVAVSSGTAALHIACMAAGLKPGDRGITSSLTFVASANAMHFCGADVTLCDIDCDTLGLSPSSLETAIQRYPETSVIIPVHFAGLAADSNIYRDIVGDRIVIEDACHALGARYPTGEMVGSGAYADMTVFSFHPVKPITTGEGGAVLTNDAELAHRLRSFRTHGIEREHDRLEHSDQILENGKYPPWYYEQQLLGYNYRITDIQAALGLSQLGKVDRFIEARRMVAKRYDEAFSGLSDLRISQRQDDFRNRSGHHLYVVEFDFKNLGMDRLSVINTLLKEGVGTQVHYIPVYRHPYQAKALGAGPNEFPNCEKYYSGCLSLPIFPGITDDEIDRVIGAVRSIVQ